MLLVNFINKSRLSGMTIRNAILTACFTRLRPVLISASVMMLAMIPLAFGADESFSALKSMSVAVIGGLFSFIFLVLIVLPVLYEGGVYEGIKKK
jgi:multidrug efflux pump subunit AcrB